MGDVPNLFEHLDLILEKTARALELRVNETLLRSTPTAAVLKRALHRFM